MEKEQECLVQTVEVDFDGNIHSASFFVENGIIHALICGCTMLFPLGNMSAAETVKALLTQKVFQRQRAASQAEHWASSMRRDETGLNSDQGPG